MSDTIKNVDFETVGPQDSMEDSPEKTHTLTPFDRFIEKLDGRADEMFKWAEELDKNEQPSNADKARIIGLTLTNVVECAKLTLSS